MDEPGDGPLDGPERPEDGARDVDRDLIAKDAAPKQQMDTQQALVAQLEGTVMSDQAQVDNAKLQLSYTRVTAPISGQAGLKQADLFVDTMEANDALLDTLPPADMRQKSTPEKSNAARPTRFGTASNSSAAKDQCFWSPLKKTTRPCNQDWRI